LTYRTYRTYRTFRPSRSAPSLVPLEPLRSSRTNGLNSLSGSRIRATCRGIRADSLNDPSIRFLEFSDFTSYLSGDYRKPVGNLQAGLWINRVFTGWERGSAPAASSFSLPGRLHEPWRASLSYTGMATRFRDGIGPGLFSLVRRRASRPGIRREIGKNGSATTPVWWGYCSVCSDNLFKEIALGCRRAWGWPLVRECCMSVRQPV
jgi:hypothetical protein